MHTDPLGGGGGGGYYGGGSSTGNDKPGGGGSGFVGGLKKDTGKSFVGATGKDKSGGVGAGGEYKVDNVGNGAIPGHGGSNGLVVVAWGQCQGCTST